MWNPVQVHLVNNVEAEQNDRVSPEICLQVLFHNLFAFVHNGPVVKIACIYAKKDIQCIDAQRHVEKPDLPRLVYGFALVDFESTVNRDVVDIKNAVYEYNEIPRDHETVVWRERFQFV